MVEVKGEEMNIVIIPGLHTEYRFEYFTAGDAPTRENPNYSGCRVTHRVTGKRVSCYHARTKEENEKIAFLLCYLWAEFDVENGYDELEFGGWNSINYSYAVDPKPDPLKVLSTIPFTEEAVRDYLDECITLWRGHVNGEYGEDHPYRKIASYYVDAYQSVRISLFGEQLPPEDDKEFT